MLGNVKFLKHLKGGGREFVSLRNHDYAISIFVVVGSLHPNAVSLVELGGWTWFASTMLLIVPT